MRIIFCAGPFNITRPDAAYEAEVAAAQEDNLPYSLISFEALVEEGKAERAVRRVEPAAQGELAVYRGWMLRPEAYERLYEALANKGISLLNTPAAYRHCHYLPKSYPVIEGHTPRSTWLHLEAGSTLDMDAVMKALHPFGETPIIVKDFVKSRKHEWAEACYIPSAADRQEVERVVSRFLELQGDDLNEGLVFREFVEFESLTQHSKSGMPLTKEFRQFFLDGKPIVSTPYWEEGDYSGLRVPTDLFQNVAQRVQSRFFTIDIALLRNGEWMIVELGDGQVAGLPERANVQAFYRELAKLA